MLYPDFNFLIFSAIFSGGFTLFGWWYVKRQVRSRMFDLKYVQYLKKIALYDSVTNLPNRRHCIDYLSILLKRAKKHTVSFSVCFMDCNGFKLINDQYGHHVGDRVLRHLADEISSTIRTHDFFARFAGDEFCLILDNTADEKDLNLIMGRINEAISHPFNTGKDIIYLSMSIGVAIYPEAGQSLDSLLKNADAAMYCAKHNRNKPYVIYQAPCRSI